MEAINRAEQTENGVLFVASKWQRYNVQHKLKRAHCVLFTTAAIKRAERKMEAINRAEQTENGVLFVASKWQR
jgi:hypothetical protein